MPRRNPIHWFNDGMGRLRRRLPIALVILFALTAPAASAQEYATETGELDLEVAVEIMVTLSGEGFVADSVVYVVAVTADGDEFELGTLPTDDQGRFFGEILLPADLAGTSFTISATGVTAVGATRVLSAALGFGESPELIEAESPEDTSTTTAVATTTTRAERGDGLDPLETTGTTAPSGEPREDDVLFLGLVGGGLVGLAALWFWLYRMTQQ
jgi:hypothetical protein